MLGNSIHICFGCWRISHVSFFCFDDILFQLSSRMDADDDLFHSLDLIRSELKNLDPFLMLDHFSGTTKYNLPYWLKRTFVDFYSCTTTIQFHFSVLCYVCVFDFAVSPPGGFPDHPHRGSYSILTTHLIMIIIIYNFIALLKGLALLYFDLHLFCRF